MENIGGWLRTVEGEYSNLLPDLRAAARTFLCTSQVFHFSFFLSLTQQNYFGLRLDGSQLGFFLLLCLSTGISFNNMPYLSSCDREQGYIPSNYVRKEGLESER